jgi:hypothetical protein
MASTLIVALAVASLLANVLLPRSVLAQSDQTSSINKIVAHCVNVVHTTKPSADQAYMASFYRNFDAFYNPASGLVENSARLQGDQKPLFIFNKCMSEQGLPLTSGPTASAPLAAACDEQELTERNGDCWMKLSLGEKQIVEFAFLSGGSSMYDLMQGQLYSHEGANPASPFYPSNLVAGFDALYSVQENRTIRFYDAADLLIRQEQSRNNSDIEFLQKMYRNHEEPLLSGYAQKFVAPNKLVISKFDDSSEGKMLSKQYGNATQTITTLRVASTKASASLIKFMSALLNIKACHGLVTQADALSHMKNPLPPYTQKWMRDSYSSALEVVVSYPTETDHDVGPQFFNGKGELSADILFDSTDQVCDRLDQSTGVIPVSLGELMVGKETQSDYAPMLSLSTPTNKFISLNAYVLSNGLQPADDAKDDPRPATKYFYTKAAPVPDAVATVLKVGSIN